jgi:hypothetical protein
MSKQKTRVLFCAQTNPSGLFTFEHIFAKLLFGAMPTEAVQLVRSKIIALICSATVLADTLCSLQYRVTTNDASSKLPVTKLGSNSEKTSRVLNDFRQSKRKKECCYLGGNSGVQFKIWWENDEFLAELLCQKSRHGGSDSKFASLI